MPATDFPRLLADISAGRLDPARLITRRITLEDTPRALVELSGGTLAGVTIIMDLLQKLREVQEEKQALLAMREALETRLAASPSRHSTSV